MKCFFYFRGNPSSAEISGRGCFAGSVRRERDQREVPDHLRVVEERVGESGLERISRDLVHAQGRTLRGSGERKQVDRAGRLRRQHCQSEVSKVNLTK